MISYDRTIFKGNKLKLPLKEVTQDLQIEYKRTGDMVKTFKIAFKELNGYKINEHYNLEVDLIKENKQYFVTAQAYFKKQTDYHRVSIVSLVLSFDNYKLLRVKIS
ncbi:hypothetical protein AGMMS49556_07750 [Endomicrobiia bacterium]|nr:hypothetical protein AGMMS49556_07750 [Endomicrobiia bacterium]